MKNTRRFSSTVATVLILGVVASVAGLIYWQSTSPAGENSAIVPVQEAGAPSPSNPDSQTGAVTKPQAIAGFSELADGQELPDLGTAHKLVNPSETTVAKFERSLFDFLRERKYQELGWLVDKHVRDTGPYINGQYYGTHPAVRVYYSPGIIQWLANGRTGKIDDGEMIIKEQYAPPAARHAEKDNEALWDSLESWTVMVKDSKGSHDGWYWANPVKTCLPKDNHEYPFSHPVSGFGHYCVRCHASTKSPNAKSPTDDNEFTFAALRNIKGFSGEPIIFRVDDSWRKPLKSSADVLANLFAGDASDEETGSHPKCAEAEPPKRVNPKRNHEFVGFYKSVAACDRGDLECLPPVTHDWVVQQNEGGMAFMSSNQCMSCHAGIRLPMGPTMYLKASEKEKDADDWHISPYGEWRWTPMGLSGRDPVFYAQMESELALIEQEFGKDREQAKQLASKLQNTCLRCHGAMGKHQFDHDHAGTELEGGFSLDHIHETANNGHPGQGLSKHGALARDGVSCMICHRAQPLPKAEDDLRSDLEHFLATSITGNVHFGPAGEVYGPYKNDEISPYAMEHAINVKPKQSDYIKSSRLCGSCHTVNLPIIDDPFTPEEPFAEGSPERILANAEGIEEFKDFHHHVEQATYLEWLNSSFENEYNPENPQAKSCQDCHMSKGLKDDRYEIDIPKIRTRIASIQDTTYPDAENLAPREDLNIRVRDDYSRHNFSGLNVFLLELFNQYDDVLGVRKNDFMTSSKRDLRNAIVNMLQQAKYDTATISVGAKIDAKGELVANVLLKNKAGHRFPSGVGFRRAFVELLVVETPNEDGKAERLLWSSGRTNNLGIIIDQDGKPLQTEFFERDAETNKESYQKHHQTITSSDQVQIYETLLTDHADKFTTSFVHGCVTIKDNRLLPRGWKKEGPDPESFKGYFLKSTWPGKDAARDPHYSNGTGADETVYRVMLPDDCDPSRVKVRASLYYQAMPPYFLKSLFTTAPEGPATKRLHHMLSNLNLEGTPIESWKLKVVSAEGAVDSVPSE